jgi:hypothetical protein
MRITEKKLEELHKKASTPVNCEWCLGKGYTELQHESRDPKCGYCEKGKVPLDQDMLALIEEIHRLRGL